MLRHKLSAKIRPYKEYILERLLDRYLPFYLDLFLEKYLPFHLDKIISQVQNLTFMNECYSVEGEDLFLLQSFQPGYRGFYVDVGCHHPQKYSNTYLLYKYGWRGINIDATPGSMASFRALRPLDINLETAVSPDPQPRPFFIFNEGALNTFSPEIAREYRELGYQRQQETVISGRPLAAILDEHLPAGQVIDVLNVDVEGDEWGVLTTNDWSRYRPAFVLLEILNVPLKLCSQTQVASLLLQEGYAMVAKFTNTVVFKLEEGSSNQIVSITLPATQ